MKTSIDIHKKFLNYSEKMEDFENGVCIIDINHLDEIILGAMLEQYFVTAYTMAVRDIKKILKEQSEKEEFEKHQPSLFEEEEKR